MNAEAIKSFLVSLGFDVDEAGQRKFEAGIVSATAKVVTLGVAVQAAALSVVAFTTKIASGLDDLYWASQRTGATVAGIQRIGYAVGQMGGSVNAARSSLENLAQFIRNSPGAEGFLNRLGVQTRDASGQMRDMASIFTGVGQRLNSMPYYRANQYAQMLGIDENTLMAMRRGLGQFSAEYTATAKAIGFNAEQAAASSNRFMTSLSSFGMMAGMARDKIGANLASGLAGSIDNFRKLIVDNFPRIEAGITAVIKSILWLADIVGRVVYRLVQAAGSIVDWWKSLDDSTRQLIALFGALVTAWYVLNSAFAASPIGRIIMLVVALAALIEDYVTWREGGQSLIDWAKWEPEINAAIDGIHDTIDAVKELALEVGALFGIDPKQWSLKWEFSNLIHNLGELGKMLKLIGDLLNAINEGRWSDAASIGKQLLNQGDENPSAMPGIDAAAVRHREWLLGKYHDLNNKVNEFLPEFLGGTSGSLKRGERNNNPGNLNFAGQAGATLERPGGRFARFDTAFDGLRAMGRQLSLYAQRGINTVEGIISTWAPSSENDTGAYVKAMAKRLGVHPQAALNLQNPQVLGGLMNGIIHHENGRNIYSSDLINRAATSVTGPSINQETHITVYGSTDAQGTADAIADKQDGVNSRTVQQVNTGNR
ncbi:lytic transglycosylase domain-containing protein [Pectobacterium carotovorum]|uniref:lytic transglycosylase domain-containing protein n=1 Tax=Pectobacterium carotovorum TaxID=554 RepID=UPI00137458DC|nr:lytic transglycosylase domain-containing protein [Pectobacterium carotovorum]QHP58537.1 lytic transglycosylase domain-containing protein [Pectobacterium carotovorum subsp. carotovorum]